MVLSHRTAAKRLKHPANFMHAEPLRSAVTETQTKTTGRGERTTKARGCAAFGCGCSVESTTDSGTSEAPKSRKSGNSRVRGACSTRSALQGQGRGAHQEAPPPRAARAARATQSAKKQGARALSLSLAAKHVHDMMCEKEEEEEEGARASRQV